MCINTHLFKRCIYPCPSVVRETPVVKRQYEDFPLNPIITNEQAKNGRKNQ